MIRIKTVLLIFASVALFVVSCKETEEDPNTNTRDYGVITTKFGNTFSIDNLPNYANQNVPAYITKDNTGSNVITDKGATLGRVLFYDKMLSVDNTIACASCHKQQYAFGDNLRASEGVNGTTGRHSMRLVNAGFAEETNFFWDERAGSLEEQTTMPIQDHGEMGFSGTNGDPSIADLLVKLAGTDYYPALFHFVFGSEEITEDKMQLAMAQFIRSIQSFDSKFDAGRANANNNNQPFNNFTANENAGKTLFIQRPTFDPNGLRTAGGAGCAGCHRIPEFDIDPDSRNNGIIGSFAGPTDTGVTRSPSLRDLSNPTSGLNGMLMHNANFGALQGVIAHYNSIPDNNPNLDPRLRPQGNLQRLNLTTEERTQLVAFLNTLTGSNLYTDKKWSDPFL